jgi:prolyl-tRNA synthetase
MGCYGIGVTRTLAGRHRAVQRQGRHRLAGRASRRIRCASRRWRVAPEASADEAGREDFYAELTAAGIEVILDDRDERPGVKFKDSELVGFPIRVGLGEKSLAKGEVEIKPRSGAIQAVEDRGRRRDRHRVGERRAGEAGVVPGCKPWIFERRPSFSPGLARSAYPG